MRIPVAERAGAVPSLAAPGGPDASVGNSKLAS